MLADVKSPGDAESQRHSRHAVPFGLPHHDQGVGDKLLRGACYLLAALLVILTAALLLQSRNSSAANRDPVPVAFSSLVDATSTLAPADALRKLRQTSSSIRQDTRLSTAPIWTYVTALPRSVGAAGGPTWLHLPSRHQARVTCFATKGAAANWIGYAGRDSTTGALKPLGPGFAVSLSALSDATGLLCRTESVGPGRLTITALSNAQFDAIHASHGVTSAFFEGGALVLGAILMIVAFIARDPVYAIFCLWVLLNERMAALSGGWDFTWLTIPIDADLLPTVRAATMTAYYACTAAVFRALFSRDVLAVGMSRPTLTASLCALPLLVMSVTLPYGTYLPILWVASAIGSFVLLLASMRLAVQRNGAAAFYFFGIALTLIASFYEVLAAAWGFEWAKSFINSTFAAFTSMVLVGAALGFRLRHEMTRGAETTVAANTMLASAPIGLAAMTPDGQLVDANTLFMQKIGKVDLAPAQTRMPPAWLTALRNATWLNDTTAVDVACPTSQCAFKLTATRKEGLISVALLDRRREARLLAQLEHASAHDRLTDALTLPALAAAVGDRGTGPWACIYLDLEGLETINASHGPEEGDLVLRGVQQRIHKGLPADALLARVAGDEFVVAVQGIQARELLKLGRALRAGITNAPISTENTSHRATARLGMAIDRSAVSSPQSILAAIQRAASAARADLDHHPHDEDPDLFMQQDADLQLRSDAASALATRLRTAPFPAELELRLAPIVCVEPGARSPNAKQALTTYLFDPTTGAALEQDLLQTACRLAARSAELNTWQLQSVLDWLRAGHDTPQFQKVSFVMVRLTPEAFSTPQAETVVVDLLTRYIDVLPKLCIEIAEQDAIRARDRTNLFADRIRRYGCHLAISECGSQHAGLTLLADLCAAVMVLDPNLLRSARSTPARQCVVSTMLTLANELGMRTMADCDDAPDLDMMLDLGIPFARSPLLPPSIPLGSDTAAAWAAVEAINTTPSHHEHQPHPPRVEKPADALALKASAGPSTLH